MKKRILLSILALAMSLSAFLLVHRAEANLSARYGRLTTVQYRTSLPIDARPVYIGRNRYYLANGIYFQPIIYQGRTVYIPVEASFQHQLGR